MNKLEERTRSDESDIRFPDNALINDYQVAYKFDNDIIKIARIHLMRCRTHEWQYKGFLQIQKIGLNPGLESLKFINGKPWMYYVHSTTEEETDVSLTGHSYNLDDSNYVDDQDIKKLLTKFGQEFKDIFKIDPKLNKDWPDFCNKSTSKYFKALLPYLK